MTTCSITCFWNTITCFIHVIWCPGNTEFQTCFFVLSDVLWDNPLCKLLEDVLVHEMPSILSLMWILHHTLLYTLPVCINQLELYAIKLRWSQGNQLVSNWMNIYFKYLITIITLIFVPIDIPIILFIELSVYSKWNKNSGYQKFILFWISDDRTHIQYLTSSQATIDHCSRIPIDPLLSLCIFHG